MRLAIVALLVGACGRVAFDPLGDGGNEPNVFAPIPLPAGGNVDALARASDGTLYAALGPWRVFRSTDGGASWTECARPSRPSYYKLAVDPVTGTLYAAGVDGAVSTPPSCTAWTELGTQTILSIAITSTGTVFGGASDGIYRWTGTTWQRLASPLDGHHVGDVAVDASGTRIYAAGDLGMYVSGDGGASWAVASEVSTSGFLRVVTEPTGQRALAQSQIELWQTVDAGQSWTQVSTGGYVQALDPDGMYAMNSSWNYGLVASTAPAIDFGTIDRRTANMHQSAVNAVLLGGASQSIVAGSNRGIFVASDRTLDWQAANTGISAWTINSIVENENGVLLLGTLSGVLRSSDGGLSWTNESTGLVTDSEIRGLTLDATNRDVVVVADSHRINRSTDQGFTFSYINEAGLAEGYHYNRIVLTPDAFVAANWTGITSCDAIFTLPTPHSVFGGAFVYDVLALDSMATQLVVATEKDGIGVSTDGGGIFTPPASGPTSPKVFRLVRLADGSILAGTADGVFRADAPSGTWSTAGLAGNEVLDLLVTPDHVIAATSTGVFVSDPDVQTWMPLPGLEHRFPNALGIDHTGRLLVGTHDFGLYATQL